MKIVDTIKMVTAHRTVFVSIFPLIKVFISFGFESNKKYIRKIGIIKHSDIKVFLNITMFFSNFELNFLKFIDNTDIDTANIKERINITSKNSTIVFSLG
jgi:hypothetical protein